MLTYGSRIVIPQVLREEMLSRLHESHQHISKSREQANSAIWWPHINHDIKQMVENFPVCQKHKPIQWKQPLCPIPLPSRPWEQMGTDLLEYKKHYMVVIDYYSRWVDVKLLHQSTSVAIIARQKRLFTTFGIPEKVISYNGSQ